MFEEVAQAYQQMLMGPNAVHVPLNFISQDVEGDKMAGVWQSSAAEPLLFGVPPKKKRTHMLIVCDAIIRPQFVFESNHLRGAGLTGIFTSGWDLDDWHREGRVVFIAEELLERAKKLREDSRRDHG